MLPEEKDYTRALSLSRLAYDLESLLSPTLAAALLTVIGFHWLFGGTVVGFLASAALVLSVRAAAAQAGGAHRRPLRQDHAGTRSTSPPHACAGLPLDLSVAAAGAMVIVNTVVIVRGLLGRPDTDVALALACFGGGSMLTALALPRILDTLPDRRVMLPAAGALGAILLPLRPWRGRAALPWPALLVTWALLSLGYSAILTPTGRLLRRSAQSADRPALFAAQFALSHACWLVTYPFAGWLGSAAGIPATLARARRPDPARGGPGGLPLAGGRPGRDRAHPPGARRGSPAPARASRARAPPCSCLRDRRPAPALAGSRTSPAE